jgi:hypothetical protein
VLLVQPGDLAGQRENESVLRVSGGSRLCGGWLGLRPQSRPLRSQDRITAAARLVHGATAGVVLTRAGYTLPLPGLGAHPLQSSMPSPMTGFFQAILDGYATPEASLAAVVLTPPPDPAAGAAARGAPAGGVPLLDATTWLLSG